MSDLDKINLLSIGNTINLAGTLYLGEGKAYLVMLPEYAGFVTVERSYYDVVFKDIKSCTDHPVCELNLTRDEWEIFHRQTDLQETEILQAAGPDGKLVKVIVRKTQRQISQNVSWQVYRRDSYSCRYCAANDVPLTVDHLVLWEEGGPSEARNLVSACKPCNNKRGNLSYEEWLKHPYYLKVSQNLSESGRQANRELAPTLEKIPRLTHKRSSR